MLEGRYIWLSRWETNSWVEFSNKKNIWIFASGSKDGWWSGAKKILEKLDSWDISWVSSVTMVSNHAQWGPYQIVNEFKTRFEELWIGLNFHYVDNFPKRWEAWKFSSTDEDIIREIGLGIMRDNHLDYIFLSGWIKQVLWLPMEKVINIHPGSLNYSKIMCDDALCNRRSRQRTNYLSDTCWTWWLYFCRWCWKKSKCCRTWLAMEDY